MMCPEWAAEFREVSCLAAVDTALPKLCHVIVLMPSCANLGGNYMFAHMHDRETLFVASNLVKLKFELCNMLRTVRVTDFDRSLTVS
jgi:hypothetical protein